MLTLLVAATLALAPAQDITPPTEERVELAVNELEAAFKSKDEEKKLQAIEAHKDVEAKDVAELLGRAVKDDSDKVKESALGALRWMLHPESLDQLHSLLKRDRTLVKNEALYTLLLKAIGQHRNPKSIPYLTSNEIDSKVPGPTQARILGLGNIRSKDSVAALIRMMHTANRSDIQNFMPRFRLSLMLLTSTDQGLSQDEWTSWWNKNKRTLEVAKEAPKLPPDEDVYWKSYWGYEYELARDKRRRKRGTDPDKSL